MHQPKLILIIMDGWGFSLVKSNNAIYQAKTPTFDHFWKTYSHALLNSFGENVGLPWGSIGSSEVGHTSIGSGRLVNQELSLIDKEIAKGAFFKNKELIKIINDTDANNQSLHLAGLVSDGGVHSNLDHLYAILKLIKMRKFKQEVFIHVFTDGRDTSPKSTLKYILSLEKKIKKLRVRAKIATLSGRFYSMDRDNRWERTKKAYLAMTQSKGIHAKNVKEAIQASYEQKITDEFIDPVVLDLKQNDSFFAKILKKKTEYQSGKIKEGDGLIFFNIRPDRMRQITEMLLFERKDQGTKPIKNLRILTLATYNKYLPVTVAYPQETFDNPLAKILSDHDIKQGHFAETEKYAHVTYFFNGGNPEPYKGETWHVISSPKVLTYDKKPEMSAQKVTESVISCVEKEKLDFVLINYANVDMVGHSGNLEKTIKAVETVDQQLGKIHEAFPKSTLIITADHGNAECMAHPETNEIDKKHTVNPIPFIIVDDKFKKKERKSDTLTANGILADIAPTILYFFNIKPPTNMTGISLISSLN